MPFMFTTGKVFQMHAHTRTHVHTHTSENTKDIQIGTFLTSFPLASCDAHSRSEIMVIKGKAANNWNPYLSNKTKSQ